MGKRVRAHVGFERRVPLDRNAKARILFVARGRRMRGEITSKAFFTLEKLLFHFHANVTGACFPTYERLAELVGCAPRTIGRVIGKLEEAGLITWTRCWKRDASGMVPINSANGYVLIDPAPKGQNVLTQTKLTFSSLFSQSACQSDPNLEAAIARGQRRKEMRSA